MCRVVAMLVSGSPFFPRPLRSNGSEETRETISLFLLFSLCGESCVVVCTHEISIRTRRRRRIPIISFPPVCAKKRGRSKIIFTTPRIWQNPVWGGEKNLFCLLRFLRPLYLSVLGLTRRLGYLPKRKEGERLFVLQKWRVCLSRISETHLCRRPTKKKKGKKKTEILVFFGPFLGRGTEMFVYAGWKLSLSEMSNDGSSFAQIF